MAGHGASAGYWKMTESAMDDYEDHYVAFIDLLGFKQQVESAERNPSERAHLVELLTLVRDTLGENPYIGFRLNYFSDSIFLTAKRTPEGLWEMFQSIIRLTQNLLQHDVLVRGGLTAGGAHHGRQFLYGTAVNRAVVSEREAKNPMTQVSDEVVEDVNRYGAAHQQWIARDNSGRPFVHYLIEYQVYRPEPIYAGMAILDRLGARIIDFVCQRLNNDAGTILEKAEWLQDYWNETVAVHGVFGRIEKGVTERYDREVRRSDFVECICPRLQTSRHRLDMQRMSGQASRPTIPLTIAIRNWLVEW